MKRFVLLIVLSLTALFGIAIASRFVLHAQRTKNTSSAQSVVTLALDWTPNTNHTGIYVALAKGWYKKLGIDLRILPYSVSVSPDILVSNGKVDLAVSSSENVVGNQALGLDVISVGAILQHNTSSLAVLADSGITRPKDLDDRIYGGFGAPSEEAVVNAIIKHDGGKGTVKNIVLETSAMSALIAKRVDAIWIYDGWEGIQAKLEGVKLRTFPITKFGIADYYTPVIITSNKAITAKKELLKKFMLSTAEGYEYSAAHPDETAKILISTAPKGTFPESELVIQSQKYVSPYYRNADGKWGLQTQKAWTEYPQFLLSSKAILNAKRKPVESISFSNLYTNDLLPK